MSDFQHDLLVEPAIRIRLRDGAAAAVTLPGLLARLAAGDEVASFPALQAHQQHAWHAFLCQLAGIALHRAGVVEPSVAEDEWRHMLLDLSDGRHEPWSVVVPDLGRPAFLQPPVPDGNLHGFKSGVAEPDALDVLVTSKNHDVKSKRIVKPAADHWVYALVSLQTMQGYTGRDNYGIVRMNSGFGSRPGVAFAAALEPGVRFRRDVAVLLEHRDSLVDGDYGYRAEGGIALVWLEPWDGKDSIPIQACDPFFIEICRRVRLESENGRVIARTAPSKARRLTSPSESGDTGDIWTPILRSNGTALTVGDAGFPYRRVQSLLFEGEYRAGPAAAIRADDPATVYFTATAMARGQGKTAGLHQRLVPLPARVRWILGQAADRDRLAARARERVEQAALVDRQVLHPALCALLQGGPDTLDLRDNRTRRWRGAFDAEIDQRFFNDLWTDLELDDEAATKRWTDVLRRAADEQLQTAIGSAPIPIARRYRAIAVAERIFNGAWKKHFGFTNHDSDQESAS